MKILIAMLKDHKTDTFLREGNLEKLEALGDVSWIECNEPKITPEILRDALEMLNTREKQIIMLRFGLGGQQERTQKEVADLLGISQSYISRLEKRILSRLQTELKRIG